MQVEDVMSPGLAVIVSDTTVVQARRLMRVREVSALPVVDDYGAPVGILTTTDLVKRYPRGVRAASVMKHPLVTIRRQADVAAAARLMRRHRIHHLVVTQAGRAIGVVSSFDLLRLVERGSHPARRKK